MRRHTICFVIRVFALTLTWSWTIFAQGSRDISTTNPEIVSALSMGYASDTYVPALNIRVQVGTYLPEMCLPVTVLARDAYNENKASVSWTSAVTLGAIMVAGMMHPEDVPGVRNVLFYGMVMPLLALNCRHHFVVVGPGGLFNAGAIRLTTFAGWRTDCYSPGITWVRWTPMLGMEQGVNLSDDGGTSTGKWLAIAEGLEAPVGNHAPPSRLFLSLQYVFPSSRNRPGL